MRHPATRIRPTLIAILVAVFASFGATATAGNALAATHHHSKRHHHSTRHHTSRHKSSGIPQGNVGDNDSDNHGGPSDGDGNI